MNGVAYLRQLNNWSLQELADKIGVSNQVVSMWEKGIRKITPLRANQLAEIFGIPADYFLNKELSEIDKLDMQSYQLKKEIADSEFTYDDEVYDSDTGEYVTIQSIHTDMGAVEHLSSLIIDKKELVLLDKAKRSIRTVRGGIGCDEQAKYQSVDDYNADRDDNIKLLDRFVDIVSCSTINAGFLHEILRAIELTNKELAKKHQVWGKGRKNSILVEDERPMTQDILAVLNKYLAMEQQKYDQQLKDNEEIRKLFEETNAEDLY